MDFIIRSMDHALLYALIVVMLFDIVTGIAKSIVWKVTDSNTGIKGLIKHCTIAWMFVVMYMGSTYLDMTVFAESYNISNFISVFNVIYIFQYITSILENFGVMGIWVPDNLKQKVEEEKKRYMDKLGGNK